jgi:hypothetical protein
MPGAPLLKTVFRRLLPMFGMIAPSVLVVYTTLTWSTQASRFWVNTINQAGPLF